MKTPAPYTMVISTCDAYRDAWPPLFTLFHRYWPDLDVPIVINTETAEYAHEGFNIICPQLYKRHPDPRSIPWSKRLRDTLTQAVDTDLVMLFLDDFYLRSRVNSERLDACLRLIRENEKTANVALLTCPKPFVEAVEGMPWLAKRSKRAPYLFNLQAGLWRKDRLLHFLRNHESPWYFERWGSIRGRRYPDDFYGVALVDGKEPIFDYDPAREGLSKGMWLPQTKELFESEGIQVDLSIRGVMPVNWHAPRKRRNWFKSAWNIFRSLRP